MSTETLIDYTKLDGGDFLKAVGTDASKWADAFMQAWGHRLHEIDHGLMIGWFANAIENARPVLVSSEITDLKPTPDNPCGHTLRIHDVCQRCGMLGAAEYMDKQQQREIMDNDIALIAQVARCHLSWIEEGKTVKPYRLEQIRIALDKLAQLAIKREPHEITDNQDVAVTDNQAIKYVSMLWKEYVLCDKAILTEDARQLRQQLIDALPMRESGNEDKLHELILRLARACDCAAIVSCGNEDDKMFMLRIVEQVRENITRHTQIKGFVEIWLAKEFPERYQLVKTDIEDGNKNG